MSCCESSKSKLYRQDHQNISFKIESDVSLSEEAESTDIRECHQEKELVNE